MIIFKLYLISVTQASWSRIRSRARESAGGFEWSIYIYNSVCICSIICDAYNFVPYRNFYLRNTGIKVTVTFTRIRRRVRVVNLQMQYRVYTIFNDLPVWGIFKLLILSRLGGLAPTILHTPSIMMFPILVLVHWQAGINMIWMQISQCEYILWSVTNINYWFNALL